MSMFDKKCGRCKYCDLQFRYGTKRGMLFGCKYTTKMVMATSEACAAYIPVKSRTDAYIIKKEDAAQSESSRKNLQKDDLQMDALVL